MSIDRSKRITFEKVADLYHEISSTYPDAIFEDIISLSNLAPDAKILEIGCGPGNATLSFAKRGYQLLGIELGPRLAAFAAQTCRPFPRVKILNIAFEDWRLEPATFELAFAADAFHWISPKIGYPKVAQALKSTGSAAFFWSLPLDPDTDWSRALDTLYQKFAPKITNPHKRFSAVWLEDIIRKNFAASGLFGRVVTKQYFWEEVLTPSQYIKTLRTFSMHADLEEEVRTILYEEIEATLASFGDEMHHPRAIALFQAKRK